MFDSEKVVPIIMKIVGGLAILLTFILFFMITSDRLTAHWMGLVFLVASEAMFFFGLPLISNLRPELNGTLFTFGNATILAVYMGVALILALLSGLFVNLLTFYMVLQLVAFFVTIILVLILYAFSHKVNKNIEKTLVEREEREWEAKRGKF